MPRNTIYLWLAIKKFINLFSKIKGRAAVCTNTSAPTNAMVALNAKVGQL
jgi:hypothetical protein